MRRRLITTLAFLLPALLIAAPPRSAMAAPVPVPVPVPVPGAVSASATTSAPRATIPRGPAATSAGAGADAQDACSLTGLVPARGSHCPETGRLRRQAWGLPSVPNPVGIVQKVVGGGVSTAIKSVALAAILGWAASGAESALKETAKVIDDTTSPQLTSSWFSASYWRVAGVSALLTLPFLCAAAIHALVRSDLGLLTRAAFGYLPLSLLAVGIASQLTMLLLAGTDEMSSIVASASLHADGVFLSTTSVRAVAESVATGDPFVTFLAAIITVTATLTLWLELLVRNAAVYVIVLMLPLFFAAMVWPARRTLAIRAIETLIALILSKFAIVAVLSLGGSALGHSAIPSAASVLTGGTLVLLAAFTPWALLRMLPLHEVASAAAGGLSHAPKEALSTATNRAMDVAGSAVALGDGGAGRRSLPAAESSILARGPRNARGPADDGGSAPDVARGGAEPVATDVADPVTSAMFEAPGNGDLGGPETAMVPSAASDLTPVPATAFTGANGDSAGSAGSAGSAAEERAKDANSVLRRPSVLAPPGAASDPALLLGEDMLELANERRLPPAGADDNERSAHAAGPPPPAVEPTIMPTQDAIDPRPVDGRHSRAGSAPDEPPTPRSAPPPELGFTELDENV